MFALEGIGYAEGGYYIETNKYDVGLRNVTEELDNLKAAFEYVSNILQRYKENPEVLKAGIKNCEDIQNVFSELMEVKKEKLSVKYKMSEDTQDLKKKEKVVKKQLKEKFVLLQIQVKELNRYEKLLAKSRIIVNIDEFRYKGKIRYYGGERYEVFEWSDDISVSEYPCDRFEVLLLILKHSTW